jgi:hypothetical protein
MRTAEDQDEKHEPSPSHVVRLEHGGHICASCGGMVGEDGYAEMDDDSGMMEESGDITEQSKSDDRMGNFARHVMGKK